MEQGEKGRGREECEATSSSVFKRKKGTHCSVPLGIRSAGEQQTTGAHQADTGYQPSSKAAERHAASVLLA